MADELVSRSEAETLFFANPSGEYELMIQRLAETVVALHHEIERLRSALEVISNRFCGIPGHAVAVGCGSNAIAFAALLPKESQGNPTQVDLGEGEALYNLAAVDEGEPQQ